MAFCLGVERNHGSVGRIERFDRGCPCNLAAVDNFGPKSRLVLLSQHSELAGSLVASRRASARSLGGPQIRWAAVVDAVIHRLGRNGCSLVSRRSVPHLAGSLSAVRVWPDEEWERAVSGVRGGDHCARESV